jgi:hypothetical protein
MSDLDTGENPPVSRPRTKHQERADFWLRITKLIVGPLMAAVVAIGVAYVQRSSDKADTKADIDKKADVTIQTAKPTTDALAKELKELKANMAKLAGAGAAQAEVIDDTPRPGRKRARSDRKLSDAATVVALKKIEAKAQLPVAVPSLPTKVPDEAPAHVPTPAPGAAGSGG